LVPGPHRLFKNYSSELLADSELAADSGFYLAWKKQDSYLVQHFYEYSREDGQDNTGHQLQNNLI
jgi:hypothetical protein